MSNQTPLAPAVGTIVWIGKHGTQQWEVLKTEGEMVTIRGTMRLSSGRTPTKEIHVDKLSPGWKDRT